MARGGLESGVTPLRKGEMFTASLKIRDGFASWADGLGRLRRRRGGEPGDPSAVPAADRPEPKTEGERALYQAMGWQDSWGE